MREEERRDRKRFNFAKEKTLCCETPFTKVTAPTADDDEEKRRGRKGNNLIKGNFSVLPFSFASEGGQRKKVIRRFGNFFRLRLISESLLQKKRLQYFPRYLSVGCTYALKQTSHAPLERSG